MIEHVEGIRSELEVHSFPNLNILDQGKIGVDIVRANYRVADHIARRTSCHGTCGCARRGKGRSRRNPLRRVSRHADGPNYVGTQGDAREQPAGNIGLERVATLHRIDDGKLPSGNSVVAVERQRVKPAEHKTVAGLAPRSSNTETKDGCGPAVLMSFEMLDVRTRHEHSTGTPGARWWLT